jgi:hypothetical protein
MAKFQGFNPGVNLRVQTCSVARTDTTATEKIRLPKGARILGFVLSGTPSDAGTTATLSIGSTTTATEYVNAVSVLNAGSGAGVNLLKGANSGVGAVLTGATNPVYVKYAETGTASAAGAWKLFCLYTDGNLQASDLA